MGAKGLAWSMVLMLLVAACGDDDGGTSGTGGSGGSGGSSGTGGTGGTAGTGGTGGTSGTGGTGGNEDDAGTPPTSQECIDGSQSESGGRLTTECSACMCADEQDRAAVIACSGECWSFIACTQAMCADLPFQQQLQCINNNCPTSAGARAHATDLIFVRSGCSTECAAFLDADGGT